MVIHLVNYAYCKAFSHNLKFRNCSVLESIPIHHADSQDDCNDFILSEFVDSGAYNLLHRFTILHAIKFKGMILYICYIDPVANTL